MTTTSIVNGYYQFNVPPSLLNQGSGSGSGSGLSGNFEAQVVLPNGYAATFENAIGTGLNSNINTSGYSNVFTLVPVATQTVNAGLVEAPANVNGEVWFDSNVDGLLDNGESGLQGITVNLDNGLGQTLMTTKTDANGKYQFNVNLGSGSGSGSYYEIQVIIPIGGTATIEYASGSGINSNINASGYSNIFTLTPGGNTQVNGGIDLQSGSGSGSGVASVSGEVWLDSDGDGLLNNGETGLSGITVNLDNAQGTTLMITVTDANGNYQFNVPQSLLGSGSGSGSGSGFEIQVVIPNGDMATIENASGSGINSNIDASDYSNVFALAPAGTQKVNAGLAALYWFSENRNFTFEGVAKF
jgi:serine-aspartate repeat-containing protein C/D/E